MNDLLGSLRKSNRIRAQVVHNYVIPGMKPSEDKGKALVNGVQVIEEHYDTGYS